MLKVGIYGIHRLMQNTKQSVLSFIKYFKHAYFVCSFAATNGSKSSAGKNNNGCTVLLTISAMAMVILHLLCQ